METRDREYLLRFNDRRRNAEELGELIVLGRAAEAELRLSDLAHIQDSFEKDEEKILYNGEPAAVLEISAKKHGDALMVLQAVTDFIQQEQQRAPAGIHLSLTNDITTVVVDQLDMLLSNA